MKFTLERQKPPNFFVVKFTKFRQKQATPLQRVMLLRLDCEQTEDNCQKKHLSDVFTCRNSGLHCLDSRKGRVSPA